MTARITTEQIRRISAKPMWSITDLAEIFGLSRGGVHNRIRRGTVMVDEEGGRWMITGGEGLHTIERLPVSSSAAPPTTALVEDNPQSADVHGALARLDTLEELAVAEVRGLFRDGADPASAFPAIQEILEQYKELALQSLGALRARLVPSGVEAVELGESVLIVGHPEGAGVVGADAVMGISTPAIMRLQRGDYDGVILTEGRGTSDRVNAAYRLAASKGRVEVKVVSQMARIEQLHDFMDAFMSKVTTH